MVEKKKNYSNTISYRTVKKNKTLDGFIVNEPPAEEEKEER